MITPSIKTGSICLGCGGHLYTTGAEIDKRIAKIQALKPGDDRKVPPNTIEAWCKNPECPVPPRLHQDWRAIFVSISTIPGVELPV